MEIKITRLTNWSDVRDAARTTIWKDDDDKEPSSEWKRGILLARHSPIESLVFRIKMIEIPYWVAMHFRTHHVGITHYISSQRDDRHNNAVPRAKMPQGALVNHKMILNAQAVISISKKRLCNLASTETRLTWLAVREAMMDVDPDMAWAMRPECSWCGGRCPEMRGCGLCKSLMEVF